MLFYVTGAAKPTAQELTAAKYRDLWLDLMDQQPILPEGIKGQWDFSGLTRNTCPIGSYAASAGEDGRGGVMIGYRFLATASGVLQSLSAWVASSGAGQKFVLGLYSDNAGAPGTLLAQTAEGTKVTSARVTLPTTTNPAITAGNSYWLIYEDDNHGSCGLLLKATNTTWKVSHVYNATMEATFPGGGSATSDGYVPAMYGMAMGVELDATTVPDKTQYNRSLTLSGLPTIYADRVSFATGQYAVSPVLTEADINGPWTVLIVAKHAEAAETGYGSVVGINRAGGNPGHWIYHVENTKTFSAGSNANAAAQAFYKPAAINSLSPPQFMLLQADPDAAELRANYGSLATLDATVTGNAQITVNCSTTTGSDTCNGLDVYYVLLYDRILTNKEVRQCWAWLNSRLSGAITTSKPPAIVDLEDNGLALKPPMGWHSWEPFHEHATEEDIRGQADALISTGLAGCGYDTCIMTYGWVGSRDVSGNLVAKNDQFPSGMKALGDYIHAIGLRYGLYNDPGNAWDVTSDWDEDETRWTGNYLHELRDANQLAEWGVDYYEYDWTDIPTTLINISKCWPTWWAISGTQRMAIALRATGRPVIVDVVGLKTDAMAIHKSAGANCYRTGTDIGHTWDDPGNGIETLGFAASLAAYAQPGRWNDPDTLQIGNGELTDDEGRTQMALWCLQAAPLLIGVDINDLDADALTILKNRDLIAVDQDALGVQAVRIAQDGTNHTEVWVKQLAGDAWAIGFFNRDDSNARSIAITWSAIHAVIDAFPASPSFTAGKELWTGSTSLGSLATGYTAAAVPVHGCSVIRVS